MNQFKNYSIVLHMSAQVYVVHIKKERQQFNIDVSHFSRIIPYSTGDEQKGIV